MILEDKLLKMSQKFSGQEYLEKAQELLDVFQPELAVKLLH
jgi:hypothetical protein